MLFAAIGEHLRYVCTAKIGSKSAGETAVILALLKPFISHDVASRFAELRSKN